MSVYFDEEALPLESREQIDRHCLAFEDQWLTGKRPSVKEFLQSAISAGLSAEARPSLVKELILLDVSYRQQARTANQESSDPRGAMERDRR